MIHAILNWKRAVVSSMVLAALIVVPAPQASAVEMRGMLKSKEVKALVANARTPAEHMKLARHFAAMAEKHEAEAKEHETLAEAYSRQSGIGTKWPTPYNNAQHCKNLAEHCRTVVAEMRAMAAEHEAMAKSLTK